MSDNTTLPGTGEIYASDEIVDVDGAAVNYQRVKISLGEAGASFDLSGRYRAPMTEDSAEKILKQLKIMNFHLSVMSDTMITSDDIGE